MRRVPLLTDDGKPNILFILALTVLFIGLVAIVVWLSTVFTSNPVDKEVPSTDSAAISIETVDVNKTVETFVSLLVNGSYDQAATYLNKTYLESEGVTEEEWIAKNTDSNLDKYVDGYEFVGFAPASDLARTLVVGNPDYVALFRLTSESKEPVALSTYPVDLFIFISQYDGAYRISFGSNDMMLNLIELDIETSEDAFVILSRMEEVSQ